VLKIIASYPYVNTPAENHGGCMQQKKSQECILFKTSFFWSNSLVFFYVFSPEVLHLIRLKNRKCPYPCHFAYNQLRRFPACVLPREERSLCDCFGFTLLERFSNEWRKTKVITPANHNKHRLPNKPIRTRSKYVCPRQARENACEQVVIGLMFTSDWSRKWREIF